MIIDECLTKPKKPHPKNPSVKSIRAACTARMQPASAQRIASQTIRAPCSAAQRIASQPARIASARASHPVHRSALHRILCIASHRANATGPRAAHCIANNPRTDNQLATHRPPRPLRIARLTAHTSHLQLCTRFAVLCAGFVWWY
jgi:hypothetical protein